MSNNNFNFLAALQQFIQGMNEDGDGEVCHGCGKKHGKQMTLDEFRLETIADYEKRLKFMNIGLEILREQAVNETGLKIAAVDAGHTDASDDVLISMLYCDEEQTNFQIIGLNHTTGRTYHYNAPDAETAFAFQKYAKQKLVKTATPKPLNATFHFTDPKYPPMQ